MTNKSNEPLAQVIQSEEEQRNTVKTVALPGKKKQEYLTNFSELKPTLYKKCEELLLEKMQGEVLERYKSTSKTLEYDGLSDNEAIVLLEWKAEIAIKHQNYYTAIVDCNKAIKMWTPPLSDYHEIKYGINSKLAGVLRTRANIVQKFQALEDVSKAIVLEPCEEYYLFRAQLMNDVICFQEYAKMDINRAQNSHINLSTQYSYNPTLLSQILGRPYRKDDGFFEPNITVPTGPNYSSAWEVEERYYLIKYPIYEDRGRSKYGVDICKNKRNASFFHFNAGVTGLKNNSYPQAFDDFSTCILIEPDNHQAYWYRAKVKSVIEDNDGAVMDLLSCFLLNPEKTFDNYVYLLAENNENNSKFLELYGWAEDVFFSSQQDIYCSGHPVVSVLRLMSDDDRKKYENTLVSLAAERNTFYSYPLEENIELYKLLVKYNCDNRHLLLFHLTMALQYINDYRKSDDIVVNLYDQAKIVKEIMGYRAKVLIELDELSMAGKELDMAISKEKEMIYYHDVVKAVNNFPDSGK